MSDDDIRQRASRLPAALAALVLAGVPLAAGAVTPYEVFALIPITGTASGAAAGQQQVLTALEKAINRTGGIGGRPLHFVVFDDQSTPQVDVRLVKELAADHVPVVLGPAGGAQCDALQQMVKKSGPVIYCFATRSEPQPGGFVFAAGPPASEVAAARATYARSLRAAGQPVPGAVVPAPIFEMPAAPGDRARRGSVANAAWDPVAIVLSALRRLGPRATAPQVRDYIRNLQGFTGIGGRYDFVAQPQRGLDRSAIVLLRRDGAKRSWVAVSRPGGVPLAVRPGFPSAP